ncbi:predicted protein [Nematostella vectensis]|uniref:Uncharacterized protein n=1 Tax=Nematostella vectensis TaxID=45351 RepID=A7RYS9_NEMVE|nr:predicted protein [Nematostella vectensis]|eukprot:XP_001635436.1 predicted protein [Nematostella vectensis]
MLNKKTKSSPFLICIVLEYKEIKEKSELNALSNPGKGKSTDPSKVHDRDPSPSSSDEYNKLHLRGSPSPPPSSVDDLVPGEFLKEINLHVSFGVVVGTVREEEYEFGFLNQSITKGQMWYHAQALGDLCVVLENYHQACIQAKYSGRSLLICSGVEPDEPANDMLASFFRNHGHGREPILLVLRAIGSNLGVVARAEDVNLSTFDGRVILKALSIKEKKKKKKKRRNEDNKKTVDHKVHFKSELLQTFIGGNDTKIDFNLPALFGFRNGEEASAPISASSSDSLDAMGRTWATRRSAASAKSSMALSSGKVTVVARRGDTSLGDRDDEATSEGGKE